MVEENLPQVKLRITVGSQAPYLYEINALYSLPFKNITMDDRLPAYFPTWFNVYDRHDFLSYIGADIFGSKVTYFEVNNRQSFIRSHSSYWTNSMMWSKIIERIQAI